MPRAHRTVVATAGAPAWVHCTHAIANRALDRFGQILTLRALATVRIVVDADACPVKEQIYRVAARYGLPVLVVANAPMRVPLQDGVAFVHVPGGLDAVDDWIAEEATGSDIVTTADLPLAGRVVDKGALCIDFRGEELTPDALGGLLASREIAQYLRGFGAYGGGPPPFSARDRGKFASKLDEVVNRRRREANRTAPHGR